MVRAQHADALRSVGIRPIDDDVLDRHSAPPVVDNRPKAALRQPTEMFRKVVKVVRKDRSQLYGAYFVLVAAQTEHGTIARALDHMGVDPADLASAARTELDLLKKAALDG